MTRTSLLAAACLLAGAIAYASLIPYMTRYE